MGRGQRRSGRPLSDGNESSPAGPGDWPALSSWQTGLAGRCPRCGRGRLFAGLLNVTATCSHCRLDLRAHDSGDGPAVLVIFLLGLIVLPLAVWSEFRFAPPLWVHVLLWPPILLGGAVWLLRLGKGVLIAQQYKHRSTSDD